MVGGHVPKRPYVIRFAALALVNVVVACIAWHTASAAETSYLAMLGAYYKFPLVTRLAMRTAPLWPAVFVLLGIAGAVLSFSGRLGERLLDRVFAAAVLVEVLLLALHFAAIELPRVFRPLTPANKALEIAMYVPP